jgi:hypothetical protein
LQVWQYLYGSISHLEKQPVTDAFDALGKVRQCLPHPRARSRTVGPRI